MRARGISWNTTRARVLASAVGALALVAASAPAAGARPGPPERVRFDDANPAHFVDDGFVEARQAQGNGRQDFDQLTPEVIADIVRADDLHRQGVTGTGVDVALIDTGIVPVDGIGEVVNGPDLSFQSMDPELEHLDTNGHGTHLAGIISGIAPDARLVNVKVGSLDGAVDVSQVIAAIDWVIEHGDEGDLDVRVIVLAYGTQNLQDWQVDPLSHAVERAWRDGILVVTAAGNGGDEHDRLTNPAINPHVVAVGASDPQGTISVNDDTVADFSSRGSDRQADLVAPGRSVVSLRSPGSFTDERHPEGRVGDHHFRGSGTSQAAAVVGGAAALLLEHRPDLSPDQAKAALVKSARSLRGDDPGQGAGILDAFRASRQAQPHRTIPQPWPASTGTGTLEGARGDSHVSWDGVVLEGEQDIFGNPWEGASWSGASWSGASWSGASWSGASWSGASWSGASWSGASWSGASWSGASWSGASWSGASWSGASWSGASWSGASWSSLWRAP